MITNERQYRITRSAADRFRKAISDIDASSVNCTDVHPRLLEAERKALVSQLTDLQAELSEYEFTKSANFREISIGSFDELADGLIKARIASNLSQKELAKRLGLRSNRFSDMKLSATHRRATVVCARWQMRYSCESGTTFCCLSFPLILLA